MVFDPYSSLAPSSRSASTSRHARSGGGSPGRMRIGVGAAVVLLLAALGVAVAVTAVGQVGHSIEVSESTGAATGTGGASATGSTSAPTPASTAASTAESTTRSTAAPGAGPDAVEGRVIFVHVLGAVAHPGLFEVTDGARVVDVVAAAGGLLPTADQAGVNLARLVTDGEQFSVPAQGEVVLPPVGAAGAAAGSAGAADVPAGPAAKVNLNTATVADLDTLPRIGPAMAQRILDYRAAQGRFASIEDLRNVTGIGEKTFAALKDLIAV